MIGTIRILKNKEFEIYYIFVPEISLGSNQIYRVACGREKHIYPVGYPFIPDMLLEASEIGNIHEIKNEGDTKKEFDDCISLAKDLAKVELQHIIGAAKANTEEISKLMRRWEKIYSPLLDYSEPKAVEPVRND